MGYKLKVVIAVIVVIIIAAIIVIFALTNSNAEEDEDAVIERDVKIFMSNTGERIHFFIEYIHSNTFRFTSFIHHPAQRQYEGAGRGLDISRFEKYISHPLPTELFFPLSDGTVYEIIDEWEVALSQKHINKIHTLIENIVRRGADREFEFYDSTGRIPYVLAIIDGNMYWTIYIPNRVGVPRSRRERRYINENLSPLIHALIDLSPYPIQGWETP